MENKRNTAKEKKKKNKGYPYKNKKIRDKKGIVGGDTHTLGSLILIIILFVGAIMIGSVLYKEYKKYDTLKIGCEREGICYCGDFHCVIDERCSYSYYNENLTENTCEELYNKLCKIGKEAGDKEWEYMYCKKWE